jgi:uncharacterized protein
MHVTFDTDDGLTLEADLRLPEDRAAVGSAVICHAHPKMGGSKDYPLLWAIHAELARNGFAVLAFNFRGVMGSAGGYGGGVDELLDVRAAVGRAQQESDGPIVVCGWSFGAHVALRACLDDDRVAGLALVAIPLTGADPNLPAMPGPDRLRAYGRPVLLVSGSDDPYSPPDELRAQAGLMPKATVEIVPGASHFFSKREKEAASLIGRFAVGLRSGDQ